MNEKKEWKERLAEQRAEVRFLIDENLPPSLKLHLGDLFPRSVHVREIELAHSPDSSIWEYAKAFNFAILTEGRRLRHASARRRTAAYRDSD